MDFGCALAALKDGGRVTRTGWGDGVFLYLVPGSTFQVNRPPLLGIYPAGTVISYRPHIDIRAADGSCSPWQPSQDSLMADDWEEAATEPGAGLAARQWDGTAAGATQVIDWVLAAGGTARYHDEPAEIVIDAPGGGHVTAEPGDRIVREPGGFKAYRVKSGG